MNPAVSVLLPSSNSDNLFLKTIESIGRQTISEIEIAVIDDGSSHSSLNLDSIDTRVFRISNNKSHSVYSALNVGIAYTKAPYIAIARAGDEWVPTKLSTQMKILDADPTIGAVFSLVAWDETVASESCKASSQEDLPPELPNRSRTAWIKELVNKGNCHYHSSILIRRAVYDTVGNYLDFYSQLADYEMWLRLLQRFEIFVMDERTIHFRGLQSNRNPAGATPSHLTQEANERRMILQRLFQSLNADDFAAAFHTVRSPGDKHFCLVLEKVLHLVSQAGSDSSLFRELGLNLLRELADKPAELSDALTAYGLTQQAPQLLMGISSPWFERCGALTVQEKQLLVRINGELESKDESLPAYLQPIEENDADGSYDNGEDSFSLNLAIFDDCFPNELSPKYQEFFTYLQQIKNTHIFSSGNSLQQLHNFDDISDVIEEFGAKHPRFASSVSVLNPQARVNANLAYCAHLGLALSCLPFLEKNEIPFVFALNSGSGFVFEDSVCNENIKTICSNRYFRGVITTQPAVTRYLLDNLLCPETMISEVTGVVLPELFEESTWNDKKLYGIHKTRIDICFAAADFAQNAADTGFDSFVECAKLLASKHANIVFHVIGGFKREDLDVSKLGPRIKFHGILHLKELRDLFQSMDIILSPNGGKVSDGQFDGFPTYSCMAAGICGVAVFCTDVLKQNVSLRDGTDFVSIDLDPDLICSKIEEFVRNPTSLYLLARNGQITFKRNFSYASQMQPRLQLIASAIAKQQTLAVR